MARRDTIHQTACDGRRSVGWLVGGTVSFQSAIWRVQGLVFGVTSSGAPELRWVLDEQTLARTDFDSGGGSDA